MAKPLYDPKAPNPGMAVPPTRPVKAITVNDAGRCRERRGRLTRLQALSRGAVTRPRVERGKI